MLEQFNYHPVRRADVCKASASILPWLRKNRSAALANGFDGLVYVVDVQSVRRRIRARRSRLDTPPEHPVRCLGDKAQETNANPPTRKKYLMPPSDPYAVPSVSASKTSL